MAETKVKIMNTLRPYYHFINKLPNLRRAKTDLRYGLVTFSEIN